MGLKQVFGTTSTFNSVQSLVNFSGQKDTKDMKLVNEKYSAAAAEHGDKVSDEVETKMMASIKEKSPDLTDEEVKSLTKVTGFYINATSEMNQEMDSDQAGDALANNAYALNASNTYFNVVKASLNSMSIVDKVRFGIDVLRLKFSKDDSNKEQEILTDMFKQIDKNISDTNREELRTEMAKMDMTTEDLATVVKMTIKDEKVVTDSINAACDTYELETGDDVVNINKLKESASDKQVVVNGKTYANNYEVVKDLHPEILERTEKFKFEKDENVVFDANKNDFVSAYSSKETPANEDKEVWQESKVKTETKSEPTTNNRGYEGIVETGAEDGSYDPTDDLLD